MALKGSLLLYFSHHNLTNDNLRGSLGTIISNMFALGSLFTYSLGFLIPRLESSYPGCQKKNLKNDLVFRSWRLLAWLQIIPCGLFGVSAYFVPNSPYWLVEQGRQEDAAIALRKLRGPNYDLAAELAEMVEKKRSKEEEGRGVARTLASRVFLLPFIRWI